MLKSRLFNPETKNESSASRFVKYYGILFLVVLVFVFGYFIGKQTQTKTYYGYNNNAAELGLGDVYNQDSRPEFLSKDVNFNLFWDTWDIIRKNYVNQPVNQPDLLYGAMAGSVAALADPHSVFFDPETTESFQNELEGNFEGIGAEIAIKKDYLTIVAPLPDSPAEQAGLRSGDKILAIDGLDTSGMSLDYAVSKIRGEKGTEVVLTVSRDGLEELQEIKIVRDTIQIDSVKWSMMDNDIAWLEIRYLNDDTMDDFNRAVLDITSKNPQGIILDLRNNPGGYLDTAIGIASEWVEDGVVVFEKDSQGKLTEHKATGLARLKDFETIVLVNEGSASGSEIIAGALQDYGLATILGETTFGKGSVQTLFSLADGSSIKLTIAHWYTPNENLIEGEGIEPDMEIELTKEDFDQDNDPQLDKAIELLDQ